MADVFSKEKRSEIMSRIRGTNTSIEMEVFRYLRRKGVYFQKHYRKVPGNPDIALPRKKKAIFIDGDFWHGWQYKKTIDRLPSNYWKDKIAKNIERDKTHRGKLKAMGWRILRIWQHRLERNKQKTLEKIASFLVGD